MLRKRVLVSLLGLTLLALTTAADVDCFASNPECRFACGDD